MSDAAEEVLQAGIRDAKAALSAMQALSTDWLVFANACQTRQPEIAHIYGARLVALVESAVDLFLSSHRRMAQYERIQKGVEE